MTYDLKTARLPKLGTAALRAVVALAENPVVGPALISKLKKDGGISGIRDLHVDEPPTLMPMHAAGNRPVPALVPASEPPGAAPGFRFPGIDDFHAAYRSGRVTPLDIAERFLAQRAESESGSKPLRAFIAVNRENLLAQAAASTARWRSGAPLGLFDGVPAAIKDEMDVAGYGTTTGTKFLGRTPATEDCTVAARLRAAGALLVGKANMHEIGINVTGLNPHHGCTRNPYNDAYHTGASSSGPATAVASGLTPIGIGADGGGSIRIPSALTGLVGLKATFGRVSEFGAAPLCWSLAYIGPMTTSVRDCALTYELIAGSDARDHHSLGHPDVTIDAEMPGSLEGLRLGVYWPWFRHATPEVVQQCEKLLNALANRGARIVEVDIPELNAQRVAHIVTITSEMAAAMDRYYAAHRLDFGLDVRVNMKVARSWMSDEYVTAQRIRTRAIAIWTKALANVDAIITPTTGRAAPKINEAALPDGESDLTTSLEIMRYAVNSNLTGHPAISMPAGYDAAGLPIGLQAIGHPWQEQLLLRIAGAAEQIVERKAPRRWYPLLDS
jgi:Asp-tRNA(Asn)/Glu-tRNA(Gln) amidotransferase A subunit family amidase